MMELLRVSSVLLSVFVVSVYSAMWNAPTNIDRLKDHPGKCYESEFRLEFMDAGEKRTPVGQCLLISCMEDGSIIYKGCPEVTGCADIGADYAKPYPKCCPTCKMPY